jgi:quercetin dioxygenase-like cupin family protein
MKNKSPARIGMAVALVALGFMASEAIHAQEGIKRTPLQKTEVPSAGQEVVMGMAEIASGVSIGRHTHPGTEMGYVVDGEGTLTVEGGAEIPLRPGVTYKIETGKVHDAKASGDNPLKVIAVYVVETGKPMAAAAQ